MEKEPQWRGHRTAERRKTDDGFQYRDPVNQTLAIKLLLWGAADPLSEGANLPKIDQFVEDLERRDADAAKMCRDRLNRIRELHKSGDMETCLAHVGRLTIAMQAREVIEAKHRELEDERRLNEALERSISRMHVRPVAVETASEQLRLPQSDRPPLAVVDVAPATVGDTSASVCGQAGKETGIVRNILNTRRNLLDPAIDKAIENAGSHEVSAVFLALREIALEAVPPFTGFVEQDGALQYSNDKSAKAALSKDALSARLRRRQASISGGNRR